MFCVFTISSMAFSRSVIGPRSTGTTRAAVGELLQRLRDRPDLTPQRSFRLLQPLAERIGIGRRAAGRAASSVTCACSRWICGVGSGADGPIMRGSHQPPMPPAMAPATSAMSATRRAMAVWRRARLAWAMVVAPILPEAGPPARQGFPEQPFGWVARLRRLRHLPAQAMDPR